MIVYPLHARDNMRARGVSEQEVEQVIAAGRPSHVRAPRLAREMLFTQGYDRKGTYYPHQLVRAIFVEEDDRMVIVTIVSYYGRWEVWS